MPLYGESSEPDDLRIGVGGFEEGGSGQLVPGAGDGLDVAEKERMVSKGGLEGDEAS